MNDVLRHKGYKSTRLQILGTITIFVTIAYTFADVTAEQWINYLIWAFGIYSGSEVGAKGATAYAIKNDS